MRKVSKFWLPDVDVGPKSLAKFNWEKGYVVGLAEGRRLERSALRRRFKKDMDELKRDAVDREFIMHVTKPAKRKEGR
jgi:hypothetical protein